MTAALCIANLKFVTSRIDKQMRSAVKECADDVMNESKTVWCPVDTGAMKASGDVQITKDTSTEFTVTLTYGKNLNYPVYVHEIPYHHNHGSWKFLSTPVNRSLPKLIKMVTNDVKL